MRADQPARAVAQHEMDGDDVGLAEQVFLRDVVGAARRRFFRREVLAPGDHVHAEGFRHRGRALAELAEADHAQRHAFEVAPERHLPGFARFHARVLEADAAGEFQHQPEHDAGGGRADRAGAADGDAALGGGLEVERIVLGAGGDQELEVRQRLDHFARERRALAHADHDGEALQGLDRLVRPREGLVEDRELDVFGERRPVGERKRDVLVVVQDGCAKHSLPPFSRAARPVPGGRHHRAVSAECHSARRVARSRPRFSAAASVRAWPARPVPARAYSAAPDGMAAPCRG